MTPDTPRSTDGARVSTLVAVLVLLVSALTAGSAAAAAGTAPDPTDGAPVVGTASASAGSPVASAASPSGFIVSSTPSSSEPSAPAAVRSAPTTVASGSEDGSVGRPSRSAPSPAPARATVDSSVVTATRSPTSPRPGLAQLHSGGPLVGSASSRAPAARPAVARTPGAAVPRGLPSPAPAARVSVSVPMEGVFLSGSTSARRPGQRPVAAVGLPVGPAGLGSVSLRSPWGSPVPGGSAWLGSAPVSSSGAGGVSLLGLNALLVALTLLGAGSWRRGWVCPEVGLESLVLVSALDRPG